MGIKQVLARAGVPPMYFDMPYLSPESVKLLAEAAYRQGRIDAMTEQGIDKARQLDALGADLARATA